MSSVEKLDCIPDSAVLRYLVIDSLASRVYNPDLVHREVVMLTQEEESR